FLFLTDVLTSSGTRSVPCKLQAGHEGRCWARISALPTNSCRRSRQLSVQRTEWVHSSTSRSVKQSYTTTRTQSVPAFVRQGITMTANLPTVDFQTYLSPSG